MGGVWQCGLLPPSSPLSYGTDCYFQFAAHISSQADFLLAFVLRSVIPVRAVGQQHVVVRVILMLAY